jgi:hypothetical protein
MEDVYLLYPMEHRRGRRTTCRPTSTTIFENSSIGANGAEVGQALAPFVKKVSVTRVKDK